MISFLLAALLAIPRPHVPAPEAALTQPAPPISDAEIEQRVNTYLSSIDTPIPAARWQALGPRAAPALTAIANSSDEFPSRRASAVHGLVMAAPEQAAAVVTRLAQDEAQPVSVRIAALHGLSRTSVSPQVAASKAATVLRSARDPGVRGMAAELVAASGKSGCAQVKAQVEREEPAQRPNYRRALARCGE